MPRPKKTNVTWFPHPVSHGRKMSLLERKYGNDGYAVWFKILEELGGAESHCISLSTEAQIELYAARCLVTEELFMQILGDLILWGEFDREIWATRGALYSEKFIDSVSEVYRKRKVAPPTRADILSTFPALAEETTTPEAPPTPGWRTPPAAHPVHLAQTGGAAQAGTPSNYEDLMRLPVLDAARALTGDTTDRAENTWRKYLRILSSEDASRGERMFRDQLTQLYGEMKAGEIRHPAAMLTKRLKEIAS